MPSCNRYGLTEKCPCVPAARYSVMVQSKRLSKEYRKRIRGLSFETIKEADEFRQFISNQCMRRQYEFVLDNFAYTNRSEEYARHQFEREVLSFPGAIYHGKIPVQKSNMRTQGPSFGTNKKRPINSNMEYQPPTQRKCMGLSRQRYLSMGASSAPRGHRMLVSQDQIHRRAQIHRSAQFHRSAQIPRNAQFHRSARPMLDFEPTRDPSERMRPRFNRARMHAMLDRSWQEVVPRSARPMSQHYPMRFRSLATAPTMNPPDTTRSSKYMDPMARTMNPPDTTRSTQDITAAPSTVRSLSVESTSHCDDNTQMKDLLRNVISSCVNQQSRMFTT